MHSIPADARVQFVENLEVMPYPASGATRYLPSSLDKGEITDVTAADGTPGVRCIAVANDIAWALYSARGATSEIVNPVLNDKYTILFNIRASRGFSLSVIIGAGGASTNAVSVQAFTTPTVLQTKRLTFSVNDVMVANGNGFIKFLVQAGSWTPGDWFEISKVMIVKGVYAGDFGAGNLPGWQWTGAANASTSRGYPKALPAS